MKVNITRKIFGLIVPAAILLTACNLPGNPPTPDLSQIVSQTKTAMAVSLFLTATAQPVSPQPANPSETPTSNPTAIPPTIVQQTPAATEPAASTTSPPPTGIPGCTNRAEFVSETVPDNSIFSPGQEFIKTWTLRNNGSCTWNPEYALIFIRGEQMSGTSPSPIGKVVAPGQTIQIYLPQTAPAAAGVYQGFWMLRSTDGIQFGLGDDAKTEFWVKIQAVPGANPTTNPTPSGGPQNLGDPSWTVGFGAGSNPFFLGTDSGIDYDITDGRLVMTAINPTGDQWRVAQPSFLDDFYLQSSFLTGSACSAKDGYGLIVRAPSQPSGNINSGYVFSFSCDGHYRVYRMDNGNFISIQNWTLNPAIRSGANQSNVMGISAQGQRFQFYANNTLLFEFIDGAYIGGLYGLVIRSELTTNFQVFVDEIAGWIIP